MDKSVAIVFILCYIGCMDIEEAQEELDTESKEAIEQQEEEVIDDNGY